MTTLSEVRVQGATKAAGWQLDHLVNKWNNTRAEFPQVCAHELFEQQVSREPAAIALEHGRVQISYQELNERANKVAHHLRRSGVGPDVLVGVCFDRSPQMVVALLAVWKAGGAYVPLDPSYPLERLAFMIEDSQTPILLTEEKHRRLFEAAATRLICLDSDWPMLSREPRENPSPITAPTNLAYVMYTSGSTGKPKGAMILHRGLVNYLWWAIKAYEVGPGSSVPLHSSISFDLTVTSLYTPLLAGGSVELLSEDVAAQSLVAALLRSGDRGLVKITPAHLELLSRQIDRSEAVNFSRAFVIGGENLLAETLQFWRDAAPDTRLINEYGPTETVVGCCVYEVQRGDPRTGSVPIGQPIANTQLYVLDASLEPVPPGATGELYIGGAGVALGYLNRPELTAERFLADPFSRDPEARLYKTGDLARYRKDGMLEYLGRVDDQVKIRGYRVELGEIEAALASHRRVQSCTVVAREDEPGRKILVAYVVPHDSKTSGGDELRAFLKDTLPEYMIPAQFVFLDSLPLTPNGKVDRKALPVPSRESIAAGKGGAPRSRSEETVAEIWSELLKVDGIGIHDDFFDLGADSLTATALVAKIRGAFSVELSLASLFERPTIAGIAEMIDVLALARGGPGAQAALGQREEFTL
ncbi:non-ribosomal peptide synthetase [Bradyrhizobium sp. CCBAU 51745]|uniref:non-ribosomal peptide synthetase n=1 Tax=Bradyrhizobium sp. CCBAU 51745 TaxID=1325099 RepID=UPI002304F529|nr:amino acid adenylation domain-containing protein [Bradyrhizobium sp. CCBAU 51745]